MDVGNFTGLPTMSGHLSTFYENIGKEVTVTTRAHTGSNKDVERSFVPLVWNKGCFNCVAGRVKMGYKYVNKELRKGEKIHVLLSALGL